MGSVSSCCERKQTEGEELIKGDHAYIIAKDKKRFLANKNSVHCPDAEFAECCQNGHYGAKLH